MTVPTANEQQSKRRTLVLLSALAVGMFGFGFALVPLYGLFCQLTGVQSVEQRTSSDAGGADPQRAEQVGDRWVTVKFDGTVHPDLPWEFRPLERNVRVRVGDAHEVRFVAENRSSSPVTGQAIPSVAPWQATAFFNKMECFCFRQQTLEGNQVAEMPLRFLVSPDLPEGIDSLTLSYNFMRTDKTASVAARD
jgi:cytochrome c oxidase assembly protein subunit 11